MVCHLDFSDLQHITARNILTKGAFFWDYSRMGLLGIDGICVLLGAIPFSEWTEYHSVHSAPDSRMNRMNRIQFTWNTQNTRSFGKLLAGNPTRPSAPVAWLPVGSCSSSQVTSAMSIPFSEWMSILLETEITCILLFLNRNRNSQNSPKRMHPKWISHIVTFDSGQTRQICEKQEKYLKGKVVTFTVQSLILCQYPVDLLTFLVLY